MWQINNVMLILFSLMLDKLFLFSYFELKFYGADEG